MNRTASSLCLLLVLTAYVAAQIDVAPTATTAKNYCTNSNCTKCELKAIGTMKSCETCIYSVNSLVVGQTDVYECIRRNSYSNCTSYHSASNVSMTGCSSCKPSYVRKERATSTVVGKVDYECVKKLSADIANCDIHSVSWNGSLETVTCSGCKEGYGLAVDNLSCPVLDKSLQKANCSYHSSTGACTSCKSGNRVVLDSCAAYFHKGCRRSSTDGTICERCDTGNSYYAVDVGLLDSQVCKYNAIILKLSALVLALITLF